jgi:hypothetical protein
VLGTALQASAGAAELEVHFSKLTASPLRPLMPRPSPSPFPLPLFLLQWTTRSAPVDSSRAALTGSSRKEEGDVQGKPRHLLFQNRAV